MDNRRTEQDYRARVARAVAAIVADPMADHRLEDLARLAHFSPFHFHRVYASVAGETVAATVRRVRLALATRLLEVADQSITQVALAVGYESPQAFTRAFGQFTGQSPREFQRQMIRTVLDVDAPPSSGHDSGASPAVRIVERTEQRMHALRHRGPFATIPHTHRRLRLHAGARVLSEHWGASFSDLEDTSGFRYYAAFASPDPWPEDDTEIEMLDIPGGRYAVHRLAGPYARINAAVQSLYARWLPGSGYEPDDRPTLEHYLNSPRTASQAELRTDLLIPIRRTNTL